jgi:NitT/TauT family transport system ATP-binding protein/sulfonate transport system ATP-binding protein
VSKLVVEGVSKSFAATRAVERIDLAIADNEFLCILGPSGCGKSTLLRIVAGLEAPSTGRVLLDGQPVERPGPDRGMVFQSYTLFPGSPSDKTSCSEHRRRKGRFADSRSA